MTIQEKSIEQLERISSHLSAIGETEDYTDIAIHALEKQLGEDCISRAEVVDEINRMGIDAFKTYNDYSELFDFVDSLPSVTPSYNGVKSELEPCEEDVTKFYYVKSLDDYWIGKRLDTMYYAEWDFELQAFVWTHSKYLPWGEHVVAPNTLWKEYTYPSEPKEIPFEKWIKGFLKKHGRDQQPSGDCVSREGAIKIFGEVHPLDYNKQSYIANIQKLPSVTPQQTRWIPVSERLPEEAGVYLVSMNRLGYPQREVDGFACGRWERFGNDVIAWCKVPEPYKAESEDKE